ncbi:MAG: hypothetical protein J6B06_08655 [Lachnospiraceae bacterium]|nr:hypothetical protein [Lachnospiraceae bacterium]
MSYDVLKNAINSHNNIVFLSGIGFTRELGIPYYTDADEAYDVEKNYRYSPEDLFSSGFYSTRPELFYRYYRERILHLDKQPNEAYYALVRLEQSGKLKAIVTRSIYGMHRLAGNHNVIELYGNIHRNKCIRCGAEHTAAYIKESRGIPKCMYCQGAIRPEVSFYGDMIDNGRITAAAEAISHADMLIVGGTHLEAYLCERFLQYFHGDELALINTEKNYSDRKATITIYDTVSNVLPLVIP